VVRRAGLRALGFAPGRQQVCRVREACVVGVEWNPALVCLSRRRVYGSPGRAPLVGCVVCPRKLCRRVGGGARCAARGPAGI